VEAHGEPISEPAGSQSLTATAACFRLSLAELLPPDLPTRALAAGSALTPLKDLDPHGADLDPPTRAPSRALSPEDLDPSDANLNALPRSAAASDLGSFSPDRSGVRSFTPPGCAAPTSRVSIAGELHCKRLVRRGRGRSRESKGEGEGVRAQEKGNETSSLLLCNG
jgi:hypothetical protein